MNLFSESRELLRLLGRGDGWMNYWTQDTPTIWWKQNPPPFPDRWQSVYFCVNPRYTRLGGLRRGRNTDVSTVNCLYADFDHIRHDQLAINPKPTALVNSGGGCHAYWVFDEPVRLIEDNDLAIINLQRRWVTFVGADPAACDLARVLRVPGSMNHKYTPARPVELLDLDQTRLYNPAELAGMIPEEKRPQDGWTVTGNSSASGSVEGFYSRALELARERGRNHAGLWLACQLRDAGLTSTEAYNLLDRYRQVVTGWNGHEYTRQEIRDTLKGAFSRARRDPAEKIL